MIQAPTCAEHSCMAIVLLLLLQKFCHIVSACSSCESSLAPDRSPNWFYKNLLLLDWNKKPPFKTFSLGSLRNRVHICIYAAWIGRRDPPLQGLSCCLVKHFDISGSEIVGSCIKLTGSVIWRVPRGDVVGRATEGVGIAVACSVVRYVQVVSSTKHWSPIRTCEYSVIVRTGRLDVHLNRCVAMDVI